MLKLGCENRTIFVSDPNTVMQIQRMKCSWTKVLCLGMIGMGVATLDLRAQEHPTLHPDAPAGIALWKNASTHATTQTAAASSATDLTEAQSDKSNKNLPSTAEDSEESSNEISYVPRIDGAVKAKFELSTYDGEFRFNVRNSRFGVSGNVSRRMTYRMQVDFNNEGKVSILDAYAGYQAGRWDVRLGQQQYHLSTDLDRGPSSNMFANRSFLAKYLTGYYGSELVDGKPTAFVRTLGSRDLGVMATYTLKKRIPLKFFFGIFNGSGINNPEWGRTVNFVGRVEIGQAVNDGWRVALAYYDGSAPMHDRVIENRGVYEQVPFKQKMKIGVAEMCYRAGFFFIEGEYARRYLENYSGKYQVLTASHIHTYYRFPMRPTCALNHIAPIVRWDVGNGMDYLNTVTKSVQTVSANRITAGVNFGFGKKFTRSEIRLNYEKYFLKNTPSDLAINKLYQEKFTIEVVAAF